MLLQFSKPVVLPPTSLHVLSGSSEIIGISWYSSADGRTYNGNAQFPAAAAITLASSPGIKDFAGNALPPFTVHYQVLSDTASRPPLLVSVSPANGATNVPVNQPVELRFSQPIDATSLQSSLYVTDAGSLAAGTVTADATEQIFDYRPNANFGAGDQVSVYLQNSVYATIGYRVDPAAYSSFRTAAPAGTIAAPAWFSASRFGIDVRFDGALPPGACDGYLRTAQLLMPTVCTRTGEGQVRFTPKAPLTPGVSYRLVIDASHEIAFAVEVGNEAETQGVESVNRQGVGGIAVRFRRPVNPLTIDCGGIQLLGRDGHMVEFTTEITLDGTTVRLTPARLLPSLTVVIDGVESRAGSRVPTARIETQ